MFRSFPSAAAPLSVFQVGAFPRHPLHLHRPQLLLPSYHLRGRPPVLPTNKSKVGSYIRMSSLRGIDRVVPVPRKTDIAYHNTMHKLSKVYSLYRFQGGKVWSVSGVKSHGIPVWCRNVAPQRHFNRAPHTALFPQQWTLKCHFPAIFIAVTGTEGLVAYFFLNLFQHLGRHLTPPRPLQGGIPLQAAVSTMSCGAPNAVPTKRQIAKRGDTCYRCKVSTQFYPFTATLASHLLLPRLLLPLFPPPPMALRQQVASAQFVVKAGPVCGACLEKHVRGTVRTDMRIDMVMKDGWTSVVGLSGGPASRYAYIHHCHCNPCATVPLCHCVTRALLSFLAMSVYKGPHKVSTVGALPPTVLLYHSPSLLGRLPPPPLRCSCMARMCAVVPWLRCSKAQPPPHSFNSAPLVSVGAATAVLFVFFHLLNALPKYCCCCCWGFILGQIH